LERCLDRVRQHSKAMQWVQEECRVGSRQWKRQEGRLELAKKRFSMPGKGLRLVASELSVGGEVSG